MRMIDVVIGVFVVGLVALVVPWPRSDSVPPSTADTVVRPWLEAMRKGGDATEYWRKGEGLPPRLAFYAVTDYEIVDDSHGRYMVRIHSSTRGGTPIVKVYEVIATDDGIYRVTAQGDDPQAWVTAAMHPVQP